MEVEDCSLQNYPSAEANKWHAFSTNQRIDCNLEEQLSFTQQTNVTSLLPEILVEIFSYLKVRDLCRIALVCRSWRELTYYKCLWQNLDVKVNLKHDNSALFTVFKRGIKKLHVQSFDENFPEVSIVLPNLEVLSLTDCRTCSDASIFKVFSNYAPHLVLLNLSFCTTLTDETVGQITLHCNNLNSLQLDYCEKITDCALMFISSHLKKLKMLSLDSCIYISDIGIKHIVGLCPKSATAGNRLLECLVLQGCERISNVALECLSNGFMEQLKTINLNLCFRITDDGLNYLTKISSLRELHVEGCLLLTYTGFEYWIRRGFKLEKYKHRYRVRKIFLLE